MLLPTLSPFFAALRKQLPVLPCRLLVPSTAVVGVGQAKLVLLVLRVLLRQQ
jgi:hypothetical protein